MNLEFLQKEYFDGLLRSDRNQCYQIVKKALDEGTSIQEIYEGVFTQSMIKVGELWEANKMTVAQEHLATAITQSVISGLYEYVFLNKKSEYKGKMILTCVGDELHELGPRMLGDLIEMDGWDVRYLGANMPVDSVVALAMEEEPNLVGISSTMAANKDLIKELVVKLRKNYNENVPIMVGGLAFLINPDLYSYTGADYFGKNYNDALKYSREVAMIGS